jgi:hypothetical protein
MAAIDTIIGTGILGLIGLMMYAKYTGQTLGDVLKEMFESIKPDREDK